MVPLDAAGFLEWKGIVHDGWCGGGSARPCVCCLRLKIDTGGDATMTYDWAPG